MRHGDFNVDWELIGKLAKYFEVTLSKKEVTLYSKGLFIVDGFRPWTILYRGDVTDPIVYNYLLFAASCCMINVPQE